MKCIRNSKNEVRRVQDDKAEDMTSSAYATKFGKDHVWKYCPKSDWKALKGSKVSEVAVVEEKVEKAKKTNKKSKKGKAEVVEAPATPKEVALAEVITMSLQNFLNENEIFCLEGDRGVESLNKVCRELNYKEDGFRYGSSLENFLKDNSGASRAILDWIEENYKDSFEDYKDENPEETDEDEECEDEVPFGTPLGTARK